MSEIQNADFNPYIKPNDMPFIQPDFDGSQPEITQEERTYVESVFATATDRALDRAKADPERTVYVDDGESGMVADDEVSENTFITGPDGRSIGVDVTTDIAGKVLTRSISISWFKGDMAEEFPGRTYYRIFYEHDAVVRREDDNGYIAVGFEGMEGYARKLEAEFIEEEHKLNNQPIGKEEAEALRDYLAEAG